MVLRNKRQEADDTSHKLWLRRWQIPLPKPNPCCIVGSMQPGGIGLHVNADKTEYMCFNLNGDISTLNDSSLKLVDKSTYLESSVSSTENDINVRLAKASIAIDHMKVKPLR